jgi:hypothetical protein
MVSNPTSVVVTPPVCDPPSCACVLLLLYAGGGFAYLNTIPVDPAAILNGSVGAGGNGAGFNGTDR